MLGDLEWMPRQKGGAAQQPTAAALGASSSIKDLMTARGLNEADVEAALKTYVPSGKHDDYTIFASGGQSGQVLVIGVPSMRLLKVIGVFTPEPWQGYGYGGDSNKLIASGAQSGHAITWADVHHPNLSETNGDYDGQFLFVNDKANGRVAVIDLKDFMTKQIVANPLVGSDHGGAFVDPNTNYVIETSQYPTPLGREYAPIEQYKEKYRACTCCGSPDRVGRGRVQESLHAVSRRERQGRRTCGGGAQSQATQLHRSRMAEGRDRRSAEEDDSVWRCGGRQERRHAFATGSGKQTGGPRRLDQDHPQVRLDLNCAGERYCSCKRMLEKLGASAGVVLDTPALVSNGTVLLRPV